MIRFSPLFSCAQLFKGRLELEFNEHFLSIDEPHALDSSNLLLRGTVIKNTEFVFALVVYTGVDSKIRMNCVRVGSEPGVRSQLMVVMDRILRYQFAAQVALCVLAAILSNVLQNSVRGAWYLQMQSIDLALDGLHRFFSWLIILATMVHSLLFLRHLLSVPKHFRFQVPISLIVSSEIIKTGQVHAEVLLVENSLVKIPLRLTGNVHALGSHDVEYFCKPRSRRAKFDSQRRCAQCASTYKTSAFNSLVTFLLPMFSSVKSLKCSPIRPVPLRRMSCVSGYVVHDGGKYVLWSQNTRMFLAGRLNWRVPLWLNGD